MMNMQPFSLRPADIRQLTISEFDAFAAAIDQANKSG